MSFLIHVAVSFSLFFSSVFGGIFWAGQVPTSIATTTPSVSTNAAITPHPVSTKTSGNSGKSILLGQWNPIARVLSAATSEPYSIANGDVLFSGQPIAGADLATFQLWFYPNGQQYFSKDKNHVYDDGNWINVLPGVDSLSFNPIGPFSPSVEYAEDKYHAYCFIYGSFVPIVGVDPSSFSTNGTLLPYAADKNTVYFCDQALRMSDAATFKTFPRSDYAKDKNHVYYLNTNVVLVVAGADPSTFVPYPSSFDSAPYGYDANNIYCFNQVLKDADRTTFTIIDGNDAKDKNHRYMSCDVYDPNNS